MDTLQTDPEAPRSNLLNEEMAVGASSAPEQFNPGDCIDERYEIISILGRGGCGCVYKVVQVALKKQFALKTLNRINTSEVTTMRLHKEAQAASRLQHPNLVRAVDFGMIDGTQPYLVMDLVEGPTLSEYLKLHGKTSVKDAIQLFLPLCNALAYAHEQGVVHRDLKPSNVILSSGDTGSLKFVPKIVDFGIAKLNSADGTHAMTLTATGDIFGTPLYMSPEQCMGTGVDGRSDIYALGCMLFETITGAPPFGGNNPLEIMMQHNTAVMPSLKEASLGESFPPALEKVIGRMLAKDPRERYQDCAAVAHDLSAIERGDFKAISLSPEAIALQQKHQKQISTSLVSAAIGVVCGAVIGYAANQFLAPSQTPTVPKTPLPKSATEEGTGVYYLDTGFSYYSKNAADKKIFTFPPSRKHSLGQISWWQDGKLHSVEAKGTQEVPKDAKLLFKIESEMLVAPDLWPRFHPRELEGVLIDLHSCYVDEDPLNQSVREITQQDGLRILTLNEKVILPKTLSLIGRLPRLRWLALDHMTIDEEQLTGKQAAQLENLLDLSVLRFEKITAATPVLEKLSKSSSLRRFALEGCGQLTAEDIQNISRIKSLEVLAVHAADLPEMDILTEFAKLTKLKYLMCDGRLLDKASLGTIAKLHDITILTDEQPFSSNVRAALAKNKSVKLIEDLELIKRDGDLFDPLKSDPESVLTVR
ncbi:MAG: serine/threonine protein kinase [Cyanobacteria bacterium SZAS-4]|nr:serine/threonine protein kinase [Cyanobacteria bacterium SZAS-4]